MVSGEKPQSGVESILQAVEKLQASVLSGHHRDSVEIDLVNVRPFDELDMEFGTAYNLREE